MSFLKVDTNFTLILHLQAASVLAFLCLSCAHMKCPEMHFLTMVRYLVLFKMRPLYCLRMDIC